MKPDIDGMEARKMREFADFQGWRVLEVGCGDGRLTRDIAMLTHRLVAIDPDPERVSLAKSSVGGVEFALGVGEVSGFRDGKFGAVAFTFSLHHVEPARALAEASRLLVPGGQLLVVEPCIEGEIMRYFELFKDEAADLARAKDALASSGFALEREERFRSRWSFRDREDLLEYFFKGGARDSAKVEAIDALLGPKIGDAPIILADESWICSMRKR